jgi:hypothetical protein
MAAWVMLLLLLCMNSLKLLCMKALKHAQPEPANTSKASRRLFSPHHERPL